MSTARRTWTAFQVLTVLILAVGTAGCVLPAYVGFKFYLTGIEDVAAGTTGDNSFPFLHEAHRLIRLAAMWLFTVLFVWGFLGARRMILPTQRERVDR